MQIECNCIYMKSKIKLNYVHPVSFNEFVFHHTEAVNDDREIKSQICMMTTLMVNLDIFFLFLKRCHGWHSFTQNISCLVHVSGVHQAFFTNACEKYFAWLEWSLCDAWNEYRRGTSLWYSAGDSDVIWSALRKPSGPARYESVCQGCRSIFSNVTIPSLKGSNYV